MSAQAQAQAPGNTNTGARAQAKRSRKFFVTFWKPVEFLFDNKTMQYACMCDDHCSEEHDGKWHGHYFVYYNNPRTWKQLKEHFGNDAHVEIPISNSGCIDYIMGRGEHSESKSNMVQQGVPPCDNGQHISVQRAIDMTEEEMLALEDHRNVLSIMKVREMFDRGIKVSEWHKDVKVTWIVGPSASGKSLMAQQILTKEGYEYFHIVKHEGEFWNKGVGNGKGAAIYDEFRDFQLKTSEFINFIDYNRHYLNIKGGSVLNNFERIIITSIQHPADIYKDAKFVEPNKQWLRRMEVIDLTKKDSESEWEYII